MLWQDDCCRLVLVDDPDYPGFCRVIWRRHAAEMSDLSATEQRHLMAVVFAAEKALRLALRPDKINLASLGNVVPHLHWHVIPRWQDDRHFPNPIWGGEMRQPAPRRQVDAQALLAAFSGILAGGQEAE
ncbi:MAG TPA: HIT family protein [Candidatus Desulfobacillus sp.]|nr:HIT family protein [Candidatus Desulfobacillus sp.]